MPHEDNSYKIKKYTKKIKKAKSNDKNMDYYKEKLAYYHQLSLQKGGSVSQDNLTVANALLNGDDIGDEQKKKLNNLINNSNATDEDFKNYVSNLDVEMVPVKQNEGETVTNDLTSISEDDNVEVIKTNDVPEKNNNEYVSNIEKQDIGNFDSILSDYRNSLDKLIQSLQTTSNGKNSYVERIVSDLKNINSRLSYKDKIIDEYVKTISDTQIKLTNLDQTISDIDLSPIDTEINAANTNIDKDIQVYSAMMVIHNYLLSFRTSSQKEKVDTKTIENSINLVKKSGNDNFIDILNSISTNPPRVTPANKSNLDLIVKLIKNDQI